MDDEKRKKLEEERSLINARARSLKEKLKVAEAEGNWDLAEEIDGQLDVLGRKQKRVLWKLGLYKPAKDEMIEYEPGRFMPIGQYFWLMDE